MEANGSPKPEFETDEERSYFISRFYIHKDFQNVLKKEPKRSRKGAEKGNGEKTAHIGTSVRKSCDDPNTAYGEIRINQKADPNRY